MVRSAKDAVFNKICVSAFSQMHVYVFSHDDLILVYGNEACMWQSG